MDAEKAVLRDTLRRERAALAAPYRAVATRRVNARLIGHFSPEPAVRVGGYAATTTELNIDPVLKHLIATYGQVYLPRVVNDLIVFAACTDLGALTTGFAGIREPTGEAIDVATLDVLLVPAVGLDAAGRRLGNGAGHYDRTLSKLAKHCVTIGVAFGVQLVEQIPTAAHDQPVKIVLTEHALRTPA